jgi:metallophosphoesterase (TIGR00282 family)
MRIFFAGDVFGRSGREAIKKHIPIIKKEYGVDVVIVNGENMAHGVGLTEKGCKEFYDAGVDCITSGNHIWDKKEIMFYIDRDPRLVRPINYPEGTPGKGYFELTLTDGRKILILNVMGRLFMDPLDDPFKALDNVLTKYSLGKTVQAVFVDVHAETTSEKMAIAHYLDGRVSGVVGTHTHIPTADAHVLNEGTAYQTDAGMCGDYNSVIGIQKDEPIRRFSRKIKTGAYSPAKGEATLCGVFIETDDSTGKAIDIFPIHTGGILDKPLPSLPDKKSKAA